MPRDLFWRRKCVLITGASSGIGWSLAEHVAARGAQVGLLARRRDRLVELASRIRAAGGRAEVAVADVRDPDQTSRAVASLEAALGPCDILVANAGVHRYSPGDRFSAAEANLVFATNVGGVINTLAAVLPGMVCRRGGHIVAVASLAGLLGLPEVGAYSASKAAVITLMQSLRVDLHHYGIRVTTICPGFVDTPMIADHGRDVLKCILPVDAAVRRIAAAIERGRSVYCFPTALWLAARVGRVLPEGLYRQVCKRLPRRTLSDDADSGAV